MAMGVDCISGLLLRGGVYIVPWTVAVAMGVHCAMNYLDFRMGVQCIMNRRFYDRN